MPLSSMEDKPMNKQQIVDLIRGSEGKIVSVTFTKKTDGTERTLVGRLGVKKGVKGVELDRKETDEKHDVITIYDIQKKQFRRINIPGIISIRAGGAEHEVSA